MAGNIPGEMAKNFHSCFACKRILEHGMKKLVLLITLLIFCNLCGCVTTFFEMSLLNFTIFSGSHRYSSFTWEKTDCLQGGL
jgi:hypothetical protein